MKIVILDTNVFGWYLSYTIEGSRRPQAMGAFNLVSKLMEEKSKGKPSVMVLATDRIEKEVKSAQDSNLDKLFHSLVSGVIKKTRKIEDLAREYFRIAKEKRLRITKEDCEIIASATLSGTKWFITENKLTINNPKMIEVVESVNLKRKLLSPKIMDSKQAIGEIFV